MKASIHEKYGPPNVLKYIDWKKPKPKAKEVLIKLTSCTVNRTDCAMLRAQPFIMRFLTGLTKPKNPILGTDFAGVIEQIGSEVTKFKEGDRVFGFDDIGVSSHAEYMCYSENLAIRKIPSNVGFDQAVGIIEGAHYARNFINKTALKDGDRVLINGASGAIGIAALQLCLFHGAKVTAVVGTKNIDLIKSFGVEKIINYESDDFTKTKSRFEFVFDTVGKSTFGQCKQILVEKGVYISSELGPGAQNLFFTLSTKLFGRKKVLFPFPADKPGSVELVSKLLSNGQIKAIIDRSYPPEEIQKAFEYVETGQKTGCVLLKFDRSPAN